MAQMGSSWPSPPSAARWGLGEDDPPSTVVVAYEGPRPQRRLTVAFRIFLAIPHLLYLALLTFIAFFAIVACWFAALFTGRLPSGLGTFVGRVVQYGTRVNAYYFLLLTDRYPSFRLDQPDYAVSVYFSPDRLNRAAVLFRFVLVIPLWVMLQILGSGLVIVSFVVWLIVLIRGRMPNSLFEAYAAIQRFEARCYAFMAMLTTAFPRGLFGDRESARASFAAPAAVAPAPHTLPPPPLPSPAGAPSQPLAAPAPPPAPVAPEPAAPAATEPATPSDLWTPPAPVERAVPAPAQAPTGMFTRLLVSKAARRIIVLIIVLGVIGYVAGQIAQVAVVFNANTTADDVRAAHADLERAIEDAVTAEQACGSQDIDCFRPIDQSLADAYRVFAFDLGQLRYPQRSIDEARQVVADAGQLGSAYARLSILSNPAALAVGERRIAVMERQFNQDYADLVDVLTF